MPLTKQPLTNELALLGLLRHTPRHGYEIYQELTQPEGLWAIWRMKQSQMYALLAKLEHEGYLTSTLKTQETRPARKIFRLTKTGQAAFRQWLQTPLLSPREMRLDFLLKFYFARRESAEIARQLIAAQRAVCQARLEDETAKVEHARQTQTDLWLIEQFRVEQLRALLNWLDQCEQSLA